MSFTRMIRNAIVDGRKVAVPENSWAEDLIRATGEDPSSRDLVQSLPDGSVEIIKPSRRVKLRDGDFFETQISGSGGN